MARRFAATALLTVAGLVGSFLPGLAPHAAASSCTGWTSESSPPPTIRVYRHESGNVDTVDFKVYAKNVLSREWIGSWTAASLRSGALAVRNYAWYQVLHWRGGVNAGGECFDLRDDTWDQVYDPTRSTWSTAAAAVDDTWSWRVYKGGHIFPTYYNAGSSGEACGANANGWKAYQWGTQACGLAGMAADQIILTYYYPGVTVTGAPGGSSSPTPSPAPSATPSATPSPTSSATPSATPTSTPAPAKTASPTPAPTATASATASATAAPTSAPTASPTAAVTPAPTPRPTATPAPTPTPAPLPTPPPDQQLPGGGQSGVATASAPPPPPPADPTPVVVAPEPGPAGRPARAAAGWSGSLEWADPWGADPAGTRGAASVSGQVAATDGERADLARAVDGSHMDARLTTFRALVGPAAARLLEALARRLAAGDVLAALLRLF